MSYGITNIIKITEFGPYILTAKNLNFVDLFDLNNQNLRGLDLNQGSRQETIPEVDPPNQCSLTSPLPILLGSFNFHNRNNSLFKSHHDLGSDNPNTN